MARTKSVRSLEDLMEELIAACDKGRPITGRTGKGLPMSAEAVAASFAREVMQSHDASAEELATKRFIG